MPINQRDKKLLKEFLDAQRLMAVATQGKNLWIANVYYLVDNDLNLYFISPADSEHSLQIKKNQNVACAIADSNQQAGDKKIGIQLSGTASEESGLATVKWMLKMYNKLHPSTKEKLNYKNWQTKAMTSRVYKIVPTKIKFFNQELYGKEEEKIFLP